ncbi:hypothetical protein SPILM97S_04427 [Streptomyces pilosus]
MSRAVTRLHHKRTGATSDEGKVHLFIQVGARTGLNDRSFPS